MKKKVLKYGVGIDMSKDNFHVCFVEQLLEGPIKVKGQRKFTNNLSGFKLLISWIKKYRKETNLSCKILMEVTGVYHEHLLNYLFEKGFDVCLEMGKRVKAYLSVIGHKSKNDKLDGRGIAQMICERDIKLWKPASPQLMEIREALRHRKSLLKNKNQIKNRMHASSYKKVSSRQLKQSQKRLLKQLKEEIKKMDAYILTLVKKDPELERKVYQIIDSVKGLAETSVLTVIAETNGFYSMSSLRQLVSYAGYDVKEKSSGDFKGKPRISKRGNVHIRSVLYMPVLSLLRSKVKPFYDLYIRLLKRNGGLKKKANVAIQRKLLVLIYTLWKNDTAFNADYYKEKNILLNQELKEVVPI
ncbi:MAG: IS110 family transposase [Bacteroidota bacterium]